MPGNLHELQNEVDHWKALCEMVNVAEKPDTLYDSRNQPPPISQHVYCCHSTDGDVGIDSHGHILLVSFPHMRLTYLNIVWLHTWSSMSSAGATCCIS